MGRRREVVIIGSDLPDLDAERVARGRVSRKMRGYPLFKAVDEAVMSGGWRVILLLRLSPVFPFNVFNYAAGLSDVPLGQFLWASWLGMLPGTALFVYVGSLAGSVASIGGARHRGGQRCFRARRGPPNREASSRRLTALDEVSRR